MKEQSKLIFGVTEDSKLGMQLSIPNAGFLYQKEFDKEEMDILRNHINQAISKQGNYYVLETKMSVTRHEFIKPLTEEELEDFDSGILTQHTMVNMLSTNSKPITEVISYDIIRCSDNECITGVVES